MGSAATTVEVQIHGKRIAINSEGKVCDFLEPDRAPVHAHYQLETGDGDVILLKIIKLINDKFIIIDMNGVNLSIGYPHIVHAIETDHLHLFDSVEQAVSRINSEFNEKGNIDPSQFEIMHDCGFDADWFWLHPKQLVSGE